MPGRRRGLQQVRAVWTPSRLRRIVRHRAAQAAVVITLAAVAGATVSARVADIDERRASWGETRAVLVVSDPVEVGALVSSAVSLREVPVAMVPDGAVSTVDGGSRAKVALVPGEVVVERRLSYTAGSVVPAGFVAMTMTVTSAVPLLVVGDLVDLWTVDAVNHTSDRVAQGVVVLALDERTVTVAIDEADAAGVAVASVRPVTVTLVG